MIQVAIIDNGEVTVILSEQVNYNMCVSAVLSIVNGSGVETFPDATLIVLLKTYRV